MIEEQRVDRPIDVPEVPSSDEPAPAPDEAVAVRIADCTTQPWVTRLFVVACIGIYLIAGEQGYESPDAPSGFTFLRAGAIWNGGYWALVACAFVHFALWHVAGNVYWLWVLGSKLERAIGSLRFLTFYCVAAFVSSAFQLGSGTAGVGASGAVYAIFGFMWSTRWRYASFHEAINSRTIALFNLWLAGCIVATSLDVWHVGNAAHVSGLLFGAAVAGTFVVRSRPRLILACLIALVAFSIVPLFWCPWSVNWLSVKAYNAHAARRYAVAVERYTQIIRVDPRNAWAYHNRAAARLALGQPEQAQADLERAREIDPKMGAE